MKTMTRIGLMLLFGCVCTMSAAPQAVGDRLAWFKEARFGMFIHFGLYAVPARGEWVRSVERITTEDYQKYFDTFNPADYNPREWARMAKAAGMKYAVMTAKHHDGFCLFDSALTDYKSTRTQIKRDLIREFVEAFRAEGLKVGLYYSVIDWQHPDYPAYGDRFHPMRDNAAYKDRPMNFDTYLSYMHGQVKELVTKYGKIDIMWFDFSYDDMRGEKWRARELVDMVRQHQPHILLNNRLGGDGSTGLNAESLGDFDTPEQGIPESGRTDAHGKPIAWEACVTMNNSWGYNATDTNWKSPEKVIHSLVNCVSKGGNLLLNVGPDANGNIPQASQEILAGVGKWMALNSRSIQGCGPCKLPKPEWGRLTQNGNRVYAHVMYPHIGHINMKGVGKVKGARVLCNGAEAFLENTWWGDSSTDNVYVNVVKDTYKDHPLPDPVDTVYELELEN